MRLWPAEPAPSRLAFCSPNGAGRNLPCGFKPGQVGAWKSRFGERIRPGCRRSKGPQRSFLSASFAIWSSRTVASRDSDSSRGVRAVLGEPVLAQLREGFEKSGANSPQSNRLEEPQGRIQFSSPHFSTVSSLHNIYYTLLFQGTKKATQSLPSPWCRYDLGAGVAVNSPSRTRASPATAPLESAPSSVQICFAFSLLPAAR